jgi:hypothetical protein
MHTNYESYRSIKINEKAAIRNIRYIAFQGKFGGELIGAVKIRDI